MTRPCRRCGWSEGSRRLWIVQVIPELPRWIVVTESIHDANELSVVPVRFASRDDALAALADARERSRILEEHDEHITSTSRRKTSASRADHEHITTSDERETTPNRLTTTSRPVDKTR